MWSRLFALALLLLSAPALAGVKETVANLAPLGLVLVVDAKGAELVAQNADEPFVPASVAKIVTAWLAMEVLGGDYRFETRFYIDDKRVLYVRGGGDPFLVSEELATLATELVAAVGKKPITGMVLDASYYPSNLRIPGIENDDEPYDAPNAALAVNFNTAPSPLGVGDRGLRKGGRVLADPRQALLLESSMHRIDRVIPAQLVPEMDSQVPADGGQGRRSRRVKPDDGEKRRRAIARNVAGGQPGPQRKRIQLLA